ncbi:MAG: cyclophilin-like fold protein [Ancrocorticia sp.]
MTEHASSRSSRLLAAVTAGLLLTSCGAGGTSNEPTEPAPAATSVAPPLVQPSSAVSDNTPTPAQKEETMSETPIRITIGSEVINARLWDNPAAQSLIDQLPLTLDFSDYGGQEVLAEPPTPLTMEGMPAGESAPAGTIGYYAPTQSVVLYYSDVPRFSGIVRIGQMDDDVATLRGWSGPRSVAIEVAD